jgi:hypothetical protein
MNTNLKLKCIFALGLGLSAYATLAHDVQVHWAITVNAAESALNDSPAYAEFLNIVSSDVAFVDATNAMVAGSGFEDNSMPPIDEGKYRSLDHFYDPLDINYGQGLSDGAPDNRDKMAVNSFHWGSVSNCPGYDHYGVPLNVGTSNRWSWQNARGYAWLGLTATNQSDRIAGLTNMFRAVGQVMHLLEDTTQPQHVRNEQHVDCVHIGSYYPWLSPIEQYGLKNVASLNYGDGSMLDWQGAGFTKMEDFWDRHLYNGSYMALNNDANGVSGAQLGLAEFCNGNFLGVRHSYAEYYQPSSIQHYPFPSRNISTDYNLKRAYLASGIGNYTLHNGYKAAGIYLTKNGAGIPVAHHSRFTYFGVKHPNSSNPKSTTINDTNVLHDYHDILIPKAVKYSAGLLDYFFRGTLTAFIYGTNYTVQNTSGQDFSGGSFFLLQDVNGTRTLLQQFPVTGLLPAGGTSNLLYSGSTPAPGANMLIVYHGTIGVASGSALDPVDANLGIAANWATCYDCMGAATNINDLIWTETTYPPEEGAITATGSASGTNGSFSITGAGFGAFNPFSAAALEMQTEICNPTDSDMTIKFHKNITWSTADSLYNFTIFLGGYCFFTADYDMSTMNLTIPAGTVADIDLMFSFISGTPIDQYFGGNYSGTFTLSVVP